MVLFLQAVIVAYIFLVGACIGSFLNVVIYRLPHDLSVAGGRSFCPCCKKQIKNYDLIPILSYVILGGKCRECKEKISVRYPLIELISGIMAIFLYGLCGASYLTVCLFVLYSLLLCVTMIDIDTMTIPNELIVALAVLAILITIFQGDISLLARVIGFFAVSLPMFLMCLAIPNAFGGGDIKLMAVCGFILGWQNILLAMFLGCILGGIYGIYLLRSNKVGKRAQMCFGPCLSIAIMVSALIGSDMIAWYIGLL